jgi:hypothetical protein
MQRAQNVKYKNTNNTINEWENELNKQKKIRTQQKRKTSRPISLID